MSSVSLSSAVWVLWYFLKPVWEGSRIFAVAKKCTTWSYTNFSRTLERKHSKAIGRKMAEDEETGIFFIAMISLWKTNYSRRTQKRQKMVPTLKLISKKQIKCFQTQPYITLHFGWVSWQSSFKFAISPLPRKLTWPWSAGTVHSPLDQGPPVWHLDSKSIVPASLAQRPSGPHTTSPYFAWAREVGVRRSPSGAFTDTRGQTSQ